ncbi:DUF6233 domain-containing protein [Streptomyces umbrinus]|uniref:DUF6233 domain-containing protein n=1 Tax=Streptomyces umbrinus TaxID=67370 RepID=UPI003C2FA812
MPERIAELGIGAGRASGAVHAGDCYGAGKRWRPIDRDEHVDSWPRGCAPAATAGPMLSCTSWTQPPGGKPPAFNVCA